MVDTSARSFRPNPLDLAANRRGWSSFNRIGLTEARDVTGEVLHVDAGAHNEKWLTQKTGSESGHRASARRHALRPLFAGGSNRESPVLERHVPYGGS